MVKKKKKKKTTCQKQKDFSSLYKRQHYKDRIKALLEVTLLSPELNFAFDLITN